MDRIAAMQSFVRTVERGSFAAAANGSGLTASMVGNHVRFLEARLGALLLNRTTRRQGLTELGRAYYERCRRLVVCASPAYLAARGTPIVPADLAAHDCPDFAHAAEPGVWRFGGDIAVPVSGTFRVNSGQALRLAALEGIGIVMLPDVLVADDLAGGRLVRLLADHAAPSPPLHLLTLPDRRSTPKLRSFVSFITARLGVAARRRRPARGAASPADGAGDAALA